MGGGMRQAGILAAACIYGIENNVSRLKDDHLHAKKLAEVLSKLNWVKQILPVETNIVIFEVTDAARVAAKLANQNVRVQQFSPTLLRIVTHLDFTSEMLEETIRVLQNFKPA